jgi:hypothetical protein
MKAFILIWLVAFYTFAAQSQDPFNYKLEMETIEIEGLPGLHSFAFGRHNQKWVIIGGRRDGLHARTPFESFPASFNNTEILVIDPVAKQFWKTSINDLPVTMKEQLQSTNMNFFQNNDTLTIIGGYGFSATANNHISHPCVTTLLVSSVIDAIINNQSIVPYFKSISDQRFALTGGQLGKIGDTYYLVGGHRFDGRYNPMNNPTFTQTYATEYKKFKINNAGAQIMISDYSTVVDPVHLRRRDYNLVPQIFPDGKEGYMISSGVFQANVDLPFLYPVDITSDGYIPRTTFNQYLSHYHSPKAALYDAAQNRMHSLFFGGLSQYYYQDELLIKDDAVPFVRTISLVTRDQANTLKEFKLPVEMPGLRGTGAEFMLNNEIPHTSTEIIQLNDIQAESFIIGYIYGGINSPALNPFAANQSSTTSADASIYAIRLTKNQPSGAISIRGDNPYSIEVYPNPAKTHFDIEFSLSQPVSMHYFLTDISGVIVDEGELNNRKTGLNVVRFTVDKNPDYQQLLLTVVFDNKFFVTEKILLQK